MWRRKLKQKVAKSQKVCAVPVDCAYDHDGVHHFFWLVIADNVVQYAAELTAVQFFHAVVVRVRDVRDGAIGGGQSIDYVFTRADKHRHAVHEARD